MAKRPKAEPKSEYFELREPILSRLAAGETLRAICRTEGYPAPSTVLTWVQNESNWAEQYARARSFGHDVIAEQIIDLADICREGVKTEEKHIGWACTVCRKSVEWHGSSWQHGNFAIGYTPLCPTAGKPDRIVELKSVTADMVERAKLQIDARKWLLSKLKPEKYGDKTSLEVAGAGGGPIQTRHEIVFVSPEGTKGEDA